MPFPTHVGKPLKRLEDPRLLTGKGRFVADIALPGMLHVGVLRSPYAHCRVLEIDASAVTDPTVNVVTYQDIRDIVPDPIPLVVPHPDLATKTWHVLAPGTAHYAGEAVAAVLAQNRYQVEDALEEIHAVFEPLPAAVGLEAATDPSAPWVHPDVPNNVAAVQAQEVGDVAHAFAAADKIIDGEFRIHRGAGMPMECRAVVAQFDAFSSELRIWSTTQTPHTLARVLADMVGLPLAKVRVVAPDVGGGFGPKVIIYPEEILLGVLAMRLGRPVKFVEDRLEHFTATTHERDQVHHASIAVTSDGTILGLKVNFLHDCGAFVPRGIVQPLLTAATVPGPYRVPNYRVEFRAVYTNTTPNTPMRGSGRPQGIFIMERLLDRVAKALQLDPVEVRRRNLISPESFPYNTGIISRDGSPRTYDSGNYPELLRMVVDKLDVPNFRQVQQEQRQQGKRLGMGFAIYVEDTGLGPYEAVSVRVEPNGMVTVLTGAAPQGQGHQTFLAQIVADALGVDMAKIHVVTGDSGALPYGFGTYAARVAVTAGSSAYEAGMLLREKALQMAAHLLEASPDDLEMMNGAVMVKGVPQSQVSLGQLAQIAIGARVGYTLPPGVKPGFEASGYFRPNQSTYASGCHAAIVEVDPETGAVKILRYIVAHDSGRIINPLIVEGQVIGGVAHGLGNALLERLVYDENGQLTTQSFMDYILPTATLVPDIELMHLETRSPVNPLGAKGAGEGGTLPVPAVIAQAIEDALAPLSDIVIHQSPVLPRHRFPIFKGH